jgi:phosphate regulon transcriptional regulator phoB
MLQNKSCNFAPVILNVSIMDEKDSRILVVDDEQDLCEILKFNLETEGYQVETANSAEEALEKDIASYNLLLLDVMMGGMSGFQLAKQLKNSEVTAHIPIIFLTARDTENDTVTGFNLGADDYISKPFSIREVMVRVRAVLRRTASRLEGAEEPAVISYQGLLLNLDKKSVSVDGEDVPFTKTEFELLRLLLEERGRVFSRQELIDRVWPKDVLVLDRTVDVNITRMRKKIGKFAKCIVTRLGFGYYFDA